MREAFGMNDTYILKTLSLLCHEHGGDEAEMFYIGYTLNEKKCAEIRGKAQKIWGKKIDYIYSPLALPYTAVFQQELCIEFLKFIRSQNCELFVGNKDVPDEIISLLFGKCKKIPTPTGGKIPEKPGPSAYTEIDNIEKNCLENLSKQSNDYRLIIVSCGNTGRVLIKRLWPQIENVFFLDVGSFMDAICGWRTRGWIRNTNFDAKSFIDRLKYAFFN